MNHLELQNWHRHNRLKKIESILTALNRSGTAEVEYFKGRSHIMSHLFGKGNPQPVDEDDTWNYARITYQEKVALEFFELQLKLFSLVEGHFFDEHFTERENQRIRDALNSVEIITSRTFVSNRKLKWFLSISAVFYTLFILFWLINGYYLVSILGLCCFFFIAWLLFGK